MTLKRGYRVSPALTFRVSRHFSFTIGYTYYNASQALGTLRGNAVRFITDWKFWDCGLVSRFPETSTGGSGLRHGGLPDHGASGSDAEDRSPHQTGTHWPVLLHHEPVVQAAGHPRHATSARSE